MRTIVVHSLCLSSGVKGNWYIFVRRKRKAANFCSCGWLDVKCVTVSVVVGFLYISIFKPWVIL
jgi:hypothetical protein